MLDRFKFRVWDKERKRIINFNDFKEYNVEFNFNIPTNEIWIEFDSSRFVLMQCTGLKDKNGKLIYEGDRCRNSKSGEVFNVVWHNPLASFCWQKYEH